ncbi:hypothetical protein ACIBI4_19175 [Streptomyces sp. NPDC050418]|uniref:hypothetical protein n=1 Tax=Streptomyces sp. NPDC050418 TaxID=3365612 RepID=UPI00379026B8
MIDLIESLGKGDHSIAILGSADQVYIQTNYLADRDLFNLDYRDGGPSRHYQVNVPTREIVMAAFLSYLAGDDRWRTMVAWERDTHYEEL